MVELVNHKKILDNVKELIQVLDINGRYLYLNKALQDKLGYTLKEIKERKFLEIVAEEKRKECSKEMSKLAPSKRSSYLKTTLISKKGKPVEVEGKIETIFSKPSLKTQVFFLKEVSSKDSSSLEHYKLSKIYEKSPLLIILTDSKGKIEYVNPKFSEVTGYSLKEIIGKNPRILKSGMTTQEVYEELWRSINSGLVWRGIFHNKKKDGSTYWADTTIAPIVGSDGEIINILGMQEDISEQKKAEVELVKFNKLAINREIKMIELKKEINDLLKTSGKSPKYKID